MARHRELLALAKRDYKKRLRHLVGKRVRATHKNGWVLEDNIIYIASPEADMPGESYAYECSFITFGFNRSVEYPSTCFTSIEEISNGAN